MASSPFPLTVASVTSSLPSSSGEAGISLLRRQFEPPTAIFLGRFSKPSFHSVRLRGRPVTARRLAGIVSASLGGLLGGLLKGTDTGEGTRKRYADTVSSINALEPQMSRLSDAELRERTSILKERARNNESLDSLLPEAFAVVREASKRVLGLRPFDVQLIGVCCWILNHWETQKLDCIFPFNC